MAGTLKRFFFIFPVFLFVLSGCAQNNDVTLNDASDQAPLKKIFSGKVLKKSNRTNLIDLEIRNGEGPGTVSITFTDQTRGIDHAVKGNQVIITAKGTQGSLLAISIQPDLGGFMPGVSAIKVKSVKKLIDNGDDYILIDSRPAAAYAAGHLPTAISMPSCSMKEHLNLLPEKKTTLLIFYCQGVPCAMGTRASATAAQAGYKNIRVMNDGVDGWTAAGYRTVATDSFVKNNNPVIIDLRASRYNAIERIGEAVSIPFADLPGRIGGISIKAPIVVYSNNIQESLAALSLFRNAGFKRVAMVDGNFQGWKQRNNATTSGTVISTINWQRKLDKGEISPAEFTKALKNSGSAVILDVRTSEETAAGKFRNARLIPLNDLAQRMAELPKNKPIYVYSATGARAKMAQRQLVENGYNASFVIGDVSCSGGACTIRY